MTRVRHVAPALRSGCQISKGRDRIVRKRNEESRRRNREMIKAPKLSLFILLLCFGFSQLGFCRGHLIKMATLGGVHDSSNENSLEVEELGRFAVEEHNKKENALLEFARVVKAKEQVVAGTLHHLTVEVIEAGKKKLYEAKVWVKPWMHFKELQEFKHTGDASITPADLGVKKGEYGPEWRDVPAHDPIVRDAADHAIKTIQQRSNSLAPYELLEILLAKAQVIEDAAKFDMHLKVKRGNKEEKYKVEVHKNLEGSFHLNHIQPLEN